MSSLADPHGDVPLADDLWREFLFHHRICPHRFTDGGTLVILAAPGARLDVLDEIAFAYGRPAAAEEAPAEEVERLIERLTTHADGRIELARVQGDDHLAVDVRDLASQPWWICPSPPGTPPRCGNDQMPLPRGGADRGHLTMEELRYG
ncbi:MAG TPA: hypothetical protein VE913_24535 [Longimicrobium sp.]|nr:hypothetical protein [Longimicrobium sp.]